MYSPLVQILRAEQLKAWETSITNKLPAVRRPPAQARVKFHDSDIFFSACVSGDEEEVEELIEKGANVNTCTIDGVTVLHQAVIDDKYEMVQFLVSRGADLNAQDNEGWTPLHAAVCCGNITIVRHLCEKGADPTIPNFEHELAVDLAEDDEIRNYLNRLLQQRRDVSVSVTIDVGGNITNGPSESEPSVETPPTPQETPSAAKMQRRSTLLRSNRRGTGPIDRDALATASQRASSALGSSSASTTSSTSSRSSSALGSSSSTSTSTNTTPSRSSTRGSSSTSTSSNTSATTMSSAVFGSSPASTSSSTTTTTGAVTTCTATLPRPVASLRRAYSTAMSSPTSTPSSPTPAIASNGHAATPVKAAPLPTPPIESVTPPPLDAADRRAYERRIADLEYELQKRAHMAAENERLKSENEALIRVLLKTHQSGYQSPHK